MAVPSTSLAVFIEKAWWGPAIVDQFILDLIIIILRVVRSEARVLRR
jgi:hypothetical protein